MAQSKARFLSSLLTSAGFVKDDRSLLAGSDGEIDLASLPILPNTQLENSTVTFNSLQVALGDSNSLVTDNISEGSVNLYYTTGRVDSDAKNAISATTGLTYNSSTGVIQISDTGVSAGSYGSSSTVPVFSVNAQGQIDSIGTVSVAGVDSLGYDTFTGQLTISTADGSNFTTNITLSPFSTSNLDEGSNLYYTQGRFDSAFGDKSTDDLTEGSNLYYTQGRFDSALGDKTTDDLTEGSNLYYTTVRSDSDFDVRLATKSTTDVTEGDNLYYTTVRADSDFDVRLATKTTDDLTEGDNLYYTTARADSDAKNAISAGTGLTYVASTGIVSITNTGVDSGTYGSASQVPVFTVNAQGQVDSIGTVSVAGVSSIDFDSNTGNFTINTADGGSFVETITLDPFTTDELVEGSNLYYTTARADSDAKNAVSAVDSGGDGAFSYDPVTGIFTYRGPSATEARAHFVAGTGLTYDSNTGSFSITATGVDSGVYGSASLVPVISVNPEGQIDSIGTVSVAGVSSINFDSATGNFTINTADGGSFTETFTLDPHTTTDLVEGTNLYYTSARADSDAKNAISAGGGLTYNAGTGVIEHTDTSTQSSVDNSNGNVIQDVSLDSYGHITGLTSTDLDTRYVNLSGDTMTGFLTLHADPTNAFHAVTKEYADNLAQGVKTAPSVRVATTTNLVATYDNGTAGVGATLTSTSNGALPTIDGVSSWQVYDGILVKDQDSAAHNGRYFINTIGDGSNPWVLERCPFCDEDSEIPGAYVFVQDGTLYEGTGWIQIVEDPSTFTVGTDNIVVTQFSGAGTFAAGDGIDLTNNVFSIDSDQLKTIIQNIDGAGSGIDADTLDGEEGSYYRINVYDASGVLQN